MGFAARHLTSANRSISITVRAHGLAARLLPLCVCFHSYRSVAPSCLFERLISLSPGQVCCAQHKRRRWAEALDLRMRARRERSHSIRKFAIGFRSRGDKYFLVLFKHPHCWLFILKTTRNAPTLHLRARARVSKCSGPS